MTETQLLPSPSSAPATCAWCLAVFDDAVALLDHVDQRHLSVAATRHALLVIARSDVAAAMALVVPFVLAHPEEATMLGELSVIASVAASDESWAGFDAGVADLLRQAVQASASSR